MEEEQLWSSFTISASHSHREWHSWCKGLQTGGTRNSKRFHNHQQGNNQSTNKATTNQLANNNQSTRRKPTRSRVVYPQGRYVWADLVLWIRKSQKQQRLKQGKVGVVGMDSFQAATVTSPQVVAAHYQLSTNLLSTISHCTISLSKHVLPIVM